MRKGFSVAVIIIILSIFGAALLGYIGYISESSPNNVKGASVENNLDKGFSVMIDSGYAWDFYEYLCKDISECKNSLTAGKKYASISGGSVSEHELVAAFAEQWKDYEYLKIFMKSSSGNVYESFLVDEFVSSGQLERVDFENQSGNKTTAIILPIKLIQSDYLENIAKFSSN